MTSEAARSPSVHREAVQRIMDTIVRSAATILIFGVVAVLVASAYLVVVPARYEASTEMLLDPRRLQVVQNELSPRPENNDSAVSMLESQMRVMQSEQVLRAVVDRLHLDQDPEFVASGFLDSLLASVSSGAPDEGPKTTALRRLQRAVSVERAIRSYVAVVRARSEDPLKAARIADTVAATYLDHELRARADVAERVGTTMTARLQELGERLREADRRVEKFKKDNDLVGSGRRLISDQQLEELNSRLVLARVHTAEQKARLEELEAIMKRGGDLASITEAVQSPAITALRTQYADVLRREGTVAATLGVRHPEAKIIMEQAKQYRRLISEELDRIAEAARNDYERSRTNEQLLAANLDRLKRMVVASNEAMVRLRELERIADSNRAVYEAFLVRAKEVDEQGGVDTSNSRVIAVAIPPNRPSGLRGSLVLFALVAGLALGTAVATHRHWAV